MSDFKQASRLRLRFATSRGNLSPEQLWDLNLTDLGILIRAVKKLLKKSEDEELAFLDTVQSEVDTTEQLRFDILKDIYLTKQKENQEKREAKEAKDFNAKIDALIAEKQEEGLKGKTIEELEALRKK